MAPFNKDGHSIGTICKSRPSATRTSVFHAFLNLHRDQKRPLYYCVHSEALNLLHGQLEVLKRSLYLGVFRNQRLTDILDFREP